MPFPCSIRMPLPYTSAHESSIPILKRNFVWMLQVASSISAWGEKGDKYQRLDDNGASLSEQGSRGPLSLRNERQDNQAGDGDAGHAPGGRARAGGQRPRHPLGGQWRNRGALQQCPRGRQRGYQRRRRPQSQSHRRRQVVVAAFADFTGFTAAATYQDPQRLQSDLRPRGQLLVLRQFGRLSNGTCDVSPPRRPYHSSRACTLLCLLGDVLVWNTRCG